MMGHLFDQRDAVTALLKQAESGHPLVRAYCGINLYSDEKNVKRAVEYVRALWRRNGFRASAEKYIPLPAFIASLPMAYSPTMDPPGKGLQRATTMHSLNAASLAFVQGDWAGNSPTLGGPLLISRRGQLATFNLLESATNYNFIVVAASGSGKSFFSQDIIVDFLAQQGLVRVIDVGRSYWRTCERLGGQNLVFDPKHPVSLNPFTGLATLADLHEMLPVLKTMIRQMAWPLQLEENTPPWEYQAIEAALVAAWEEKGEAAELRDAYEWLLQYGDERARDLAFQLAPYAIGRHAPWFTGPRGVSFDNPLAIIELEELNSDPEMHPAYRSDY
jgi:conjugal transfer ATP-binding protein TraC